MTRIYRYIHVSDDGMAPCIDANTLSLATCKPVIRRCASEGDWVMGFYPGSDLSGVVSWVARISRKMSHGDYQRNHPRRSDAVYREIANGEYESLEPDYHPCSNQKRTDYENGVLLFDETRSWYFGDTPVSLPEELMHLAARGQGHRVNDRVEGDLDRLIAWLEGRGTPGIHGKPRHRDSVGCVVSPCSPRPVKPAWGSC